MSAPLDTMRGAVQPHLAIRNVARRFGAAIAVDDVSLELTRGEFVTLLGDSGCGKTTLLRIVAGFTAPDAGTVHCAGVDVTRLAPAERRMGFVFQSYALFPTKTVAQNIGFPLEIARRPRREITERVRFLADLVEIEPLCARFPHELSGGQQQRVALARALAGEPEVLLLDEPMSALDARIRARLRQEIRELVGRLGLTTLYVTHDQEGALALSDRVAVMRAGRIEQIGAPADIYHRPRSRFVAEFVGTANLVEGQLSAGGIEAHGAIWPVEAIPEGISHSDAVVGVYRPEHIAIATDAPGIVARVVARSFLGAVERLSLVIAADRTVVVDLPSIGVGSDSAIGDEVWLRPVGARATVLPGRATP
jgi:ABC-type Fe3+/spermidine/putrescine transport system ATPase subunit